MTAAFTEAGIPREAISIYPGGGDVGAAVLANCERSMIFGGTATVERYKGNPKVQAHGPGFSKILLGDDVVDDWEKYLDLMADSVYLNSGRGCINCSGIWASRHTKEIAAGAGRAAWPDRSASRRKIRKPGLAAFTVPGAAAGDLEDDRSRPARKTGVDAHDRASTARGWSKRSAAPICGRRSCTASRPTAAIAKKEYMFPFATVVECPQDKMLEAIGPTLVCTAITEDADVPAQLDRRHAHRPPEHRADSHHQARLAATARREYRRVPVPRPGLPVAERAAGRHGRIRVDSRPQRIRTMRRYASVRVCRASAELAMRRSERLPRSPADVARRSASA